MRRLLSLLALLALLAPALTALASGDVYYKDRFSSGDYSGNEGTLEFDGPWTEFGDSGGHSSGKVYVDSSGCSGKCAHIDGGLLGVLSYGLQRAADLSMFQSVDLSYDVEIDPAPILGLLNTATLQVQVFDGGWVTVDSFPLNRSTSDEVVIDVTDYANAEFAIRFRVPDVSLIYNGSATIDNVELRGTVITTSTTTSSTSSTTTTTTQPQHTSSTAQATTTSTTATTTSSTTLGEVTTTTSGDEERGEEEGRTGATPTSTTTTIAQSTTSTTNDDDVVAGGIPPESGLRDPGVGLMVDYEPGMMGDMSTDGVEVLAAELTAEFSIAAETFKTARIWIAALALLMAVAVVGGMDRRRSRRETAAVLG